MLTGVTSPLYGRSPMAMNPRLLRPIASGVSTGQLRQGLALYLPLDETADSGNVTAVDNSGNGFNFTSVNSVLSTAGRVGNAREFIKANQTHLLGGSTAASLAFGATDWSIQFWLNVASPLPTTATNASVMSRNVTNTGAFAASEFSVGLFFNAGVTNLSVNAANTITFTQFGSLLANTWHHIVLTNSGTTVSYYRDGSLISTGTRTGTWLATARHTVIGIPNTNAMATQAINAKIDEYAKWERTLSAKEVYALWNQGNGRSLVITGPQVSNADAQDWVDRVYANGGSVSTGTANAVNSFCDDIDAAGIRDRFWRLNLFCGDSDGFVVAPRVPLYRGPSRTGTQYGNALDENNNFVQSDYVETGASGGLTGDGTSKFLDTGFKADLLGQTDRHLSMVGIPTGMTASHQYSGVDNFGCGGNVFWGILAGSPTATNFMIRAHSAASNSTQFSPTGNAYILVSGNGSAAVYEKGSSVITGPAGSFDAPNLDVFIFGLNRCGSAAALAKARQTAYSIGAAFTAAQAASFYDAMLTFQTSLSRA